MLRSSSLWALIAYEALVAVPIAVFLSMHFPMWRVLNPWQASPRASMILTIFGPIAAITAFVVTRRAMLSGKRMHGVWMALGGSAILLMATLLFVFAKKAQPAPIESGRSLGHLAIGGIVFCIIAWFTMLWRIKLLASSERTATGTVTHLPAQARDGRTKPLEAVRKSGGKR